MDADLMAIDAALVGAGGTGRGGGGSESEIDFKGEDGAVSAGGRGEGVEGEVLRLSS